jgi:antitoxin (DNA-binding transcriptional repressor) of toxin-antitoxin stability system
MIKVMGGGAEVSAGAVNYPSQSATRPSLVVANYTTRAEPVSVVTTPVPPLEVTYGNGLLGIRANKATLSEVLYAVQQRTGAEVSIAAGAEQEKVVADIAPGPAPEVLARLLNGSKFNFLILSAVDDPRKLDRVILSVRPDGAFMPLAPVQVQTADDPEDREPSTMNLQQGNQGPAPVQVPQPPDGKAPGDGNTPDQ